MADELHIIKVPIDRWNRIQLALSESKDTIAELTTLLETARAELIKQGNIMLDVCAELETHKGWRAADTLHLSRVVIIKGRDGGKERLFGISRRGVG